MTGVSRSQPGEHAPVPLEWAFMMIHGMCRRVTDFVVSGLSSSMCGFRIRLCGSVTGAEHVHGRVADWFRAWRIHTERIVIRAYYHRRR